MADVGMADVGVSKGVQKWRIRGRSGKRVPNLKWKQQSQKRYMVSGSLCLSSFINVESKVSLVVSGQWPHRGRFPLPQRKWAT